MIKKDISYSLAHKHNSLREVMKKIGKSGEQFALIVNEHNQLLGMVTDGDIRRSIIQGIAVDDPIEKAMNLEPISININDDDEEVIKIIKRSNKKINYLPVVDENNVVKDILLHDEILNILKRSPQALFLKNHITPDSKKILITGGAGYIGSNLVRELLSLGYHVKILDNLCFGRGHLNIFEQHPNFTLLHGDVSNARDVIKAIEDVYAVVHLAEIVGDPACAINPKKTQQINYISASLVARICKYFQINRFIYTSSCSVYGAAEETLLNEESSLNPVSLYARMKIESEKSILELKDNSFSPTIFRLATVFGDSPRMRFDLVTNLFTAKAIKEGKITIFGGDQWRPHVHVNDVAKAILLVLESPLDKVSGEIFNLGSNKNNFTVNEIGNFVKQVIPSVEVVTEETDVDKRNYRVDFSKIKTTLGFDTEKSVAQGIIEIHNAFKEGKYENYQDSIFSNVKTYQQ
jgi:nucleoside-diphosphate-sugar epimerase